MDLKGRGTEVCRKLHNEERTLLVDNIKGMKQTRGERGMCKKYWYEHLKGRGHFGDLCLDGSIILKRILRKKI